MHKHFKVLDSDIHIIEPSDLWQPMFKGLWLPKWIFDWHD